MNDPLIIFVGVLIGIIGGFALAVLAMRNQPVHEDPPPQLYDSSYMTFSWSTGGVPFSNAVYLLWCGRRLAGVFLHKNHAQEQMEDLEAHTEHCFSDDHPMWIEDADFEDWSKVYK